VFLLPSWLAQFILTLIHCINASSNDLICGSMKRVFFGSNLKIILASSKETVRTEISGIRRHT